MTTTSAAPHLITNWPAADVLILRSRALRLGTAPDQLSRFGSDLWRLAPAHPDAHYVVNSIRWRQFPEKFVLPLKTFALATLDHPFPLDLAVGRPEDLANVATIQAWVRDLLVFVEWLTDRGIGHVAEVTDADLEAFRAHVLSLSRASRRKAAFFNAVRALWAYRRHLPDQCRLASHNPWGGLSGQQLANAARPGRENRTPRIAPATMEALLAWSLRVVEDIGPDIRDAWIEYRQLDNGSHPSQEQYAGLLTRDRIDLFVQQAKRDGTVLPGHIVDGQLHINWSQLGRLLGSHTSWPRVLKRRVHAAALPVVVGSPIGRITGQVHGHPWRDSPITVQELPLLIRVLTAACFITACYLSGARPGEILNLESGCTGTDEATGELLIHGRAGKGRNRSAAAEDLAARTRPWVVVQPVHRALEVMDSLSSHRYLFPASIAVPGQRRPNDHHARKAAPMNLDIDAFITWVNTTFRAPDGTPPIPPDPVRHVHASRFRRSLAYFIVRRPRGLIAAALQYAHVSTKVTLSYSGYADTSWLDDLAIERLEMVIENIDNDLPLLEEGEHISGPSAAEYRARLARVSRFAGRAVTGVRNAERLLAQADPNIHHGEAMTCVWRAETAVCRNAKLAQQLPVDDAPDESECRTNCTNLAYTDRDIDQLRERHVLLAASASDPLSPRPLRDRAAAQAERVLEIIQQHQLSQPNSNEDGTIA